MLLVAFALLSCGELPSIAAPGQDGAPSGGDPGLFSDQSSPLSNADWEAVSQDPGRYQGRRAEITGTVFNMLGTYGGGYHLQVFTDPASSKGNTHLTFKDDPRLAVGYEIRVVGTVKGELVTSTVTGQELKLPEVVVESYEIVGPATVVATLTPPATATNTPAPTSTPSPRPTETPTARTSPTAAPASPTATARSSTATPTARGAATTTPSAARTPSPAASPTATTGTTTPAATPSAEGQALVQVQPATATLTAPLKATRDAGALAGSYVATTKTNQGWNGKGTPPSDTGSAALTVEVPHDGTYVVWTRMFYDSVQGNSYWLIIDDGQGIKVGNEDGNYKVWKWVNWSDGNANQVIEVELTAGTHTLKLVGREAGARIDTILLTDDPSYVPAD